MLYIYDIFLNFGDKEIIDFYDWESNDNIFRIKRIPAFRVKTDLIKDLLTKTIIFDNDFLNKIYNKSEYKSMNNSKDNYVFLLSDTKNVIGVLLNDDGMAQSLSVLLPDEELEVLTTIDRIDLIRINYQVKDIQIFNNTFLTRKENKIQNFLIKELDGLYQIKDSDKLFYYYFEYYNEFNNDLNQVYNNLLEEVSYNFNNKHLQLYQLIKLSYQDNK